MKKYNYDLFLFLGLFLTYAYFFQGGGWNQNARFDQTRAIVEKGTFAIDDYVSNTGDWTKFGEHFYPNKPLGCSFLGVPIYFVVYWGEKLFRKNPAEQFWLNFNAWLTTIFSVGLLSALLGVILYKFLNLVFPKNKPFNLLVTAGYALGTLAFPYATIFHGHQLSAFFLFASFYYLFKAREKKEYLITGGFLSGMAIMMEYQSAIIVILLAVWLLLRVKEKKSLFWSGLGMIPSLLILGIYHYMCFGNPFSTGRMFQNPLWLKGIKTFYGFVFPNFKILPQITLFPFRGLFFASPWLILSIPGFVYFFKVKKFKNEAVLFLSIVCFYVFLNLSFYTWEGGWSCGPRYLIPMLPFMTVPIIFVAKKLPKLTGILVAVSIFFMLAATAVRPEIHPAIKNPFFGYILPNFVRGNLSSNPQGVDEIRPLPEYLASNIYWFSVSDSQLKNLFPEGKYPPAFKQAKFNSFNLGELLGLPGLFSLLPLFLLWAGFVFLAIKIQLTKPRGFGI